MEFRQLTYFLAAAHTQNFRKAAELSLVTQPALSRQIAALEAELGTPLFRRVKQRVELTPAGQTFVAYAQNALEVLEQGELELARWQQGLSGDLLLGCNSSLAASFLPPLLANFRQLYPAIRLKVNVQHSDEVIALVEQSAVDIGFIYDPAIRSTLVMIKELFRQPLQLLLARDHPLTRLDARALTLERVLMEPLLLLGADARLRKVQERMFLQRGLTVKPVIEIDSIEGLKRLVEQGCGVTLIPPALLPSAQPDSSLTLLPISDLPETFIFALVYRRTGGLSVLAQQFVHTVVNTLSAQ